MLDFLSILVALFMLGEITQTQKRELFTLSLENHFQTEYFRKGGDTRYLPFKHNARRWNLTISHPHASNEGETKCLYLKYNFFLFILLAGDITVYIH